MRGRSRNGPFCRDCRVVRGDSTQNHGAVSQIRIGPLFDNMSRFVVNIVPKLSVDYNNKMERVLMALRADPVLVRSLGRFPGRVQRKQPVHRGKRRRAVLVRLLYPPYILSRLPM